MENHDIDSFRKSNDLYVGQILELPYPFNFGPYTFWDEDGRHETKTWRPGPRIEERFVPPDDVDADYIADGLGQQVLEIVSIHKPGKYPTRIFYTRKWRDPSGKIFGKNKLRIMSVSNFKRVAKGYRYGFELRKRPPV